MDNDSDITRTVNKVTQIHNIADDGVDLREFFNLIWEGRWNVILTTALFAIVSVLYAINQPNIYKSEALVAPVEQEQAGGLSALTGQFGGLASLAGVNLGGGSVNKTQLALEILKSRKFASEFIEKHNALPELMATESWNSETNTIIYDDQLYNEYENKWVRKVKAPFKSKPSMQEAYKEFNKIINASENKDTGMVTISAEHPSPYVAQQWVGWLVADINQTMKQRDVLEANKSTEFLTEQIEQTNIADIRALLYRLVEEQTKTIMFAKVRDEYVFTIIDPGLSPEEKFKPRRGLLILLSILFGLLFSIFIIVLRKKT